ncbi:MAG: hypothetical protein HXX10_07490 [Rhodoplanes sp.]|uniref:hypothetical protein n=1 Tax=Rhodoplanes sp. TaxID=1968906 RepID=UPI00182E2B35|nr:hypothetical protein [Rhodoplanes sp.]NVO13863.1 hypothetical protein [Rhodoplanes sp.]
MTDMMVAKIILEQLGGRKFIAMTGATNLCGGADSLSLKIGKGAKTPAGANVSHMRVKLTPADDYEVEFLWIRGTRVVTISKHEGVYAEDLQPLFTEQTGFDTHL